MHDIIEFLKAAVMRGPGQGIKGCYIVNAGAIYSSTDSMTAGVAFPSEANFNIPADNLDATLSRMKAVESLTVDGENIILKAGRLTSTIRCVQEEPPPMPDMPDVWSKSPRGLADALKLALPFRGEDGWSSCVSLQGEKVRCFSNNRGIEIDVPGLELEQQLLTKDAVEFIIAQGDPDEYVPQPNSFLVRWEDGRWMRAQLFAGAMPDLARIFESAGDKATVPINAEWREAYADAAALAERHVTVTPKKLIAIRGENQEAVNNVDVATKVPKDHQSHWQPKVIDDMVACATSWNPTSYPEVTLFLGPGFRGVVMGIRA